jgi:glycosyltransferase involved in cell wall biosynthesis
VRNVPTSSIGGKHFSNLTRSAVATLRALGRYDVLHFHATGPGILSTVSLAAGQGSVVTIHALDQARAKWGRMAKQALSFSERVVVHSADEVTVVSECLRRYFAEKYNERVNYIPNGMSPAVLVPAGELLQRHGLVPQEYLLFAGRMTPEKGCHDLIRAVNASRSPLKLAVAGGNGSADYIAQLKACADPERVRFLGHLTGDRLAEVFSNAHSFVLPSYIEGMSLSLLEAIAYRLPLLVSDIPENRVVCAAAPVDPLYVKPGDDEGLLTAIERLSSQPRRVPNGRVAVNSLPRWGGVASQYLRVYERVLEKHHPRARFGMDAYP